jgi:type IV secretory pathway VirB2 component (pilin)
MRSCACFRTGLRITQWSGKVSQTARVIGIVVTLAMLVFSGWMYLQTGDWVALVFAAFSLGYGVFFLSVTPRDRDAS